MGWEGIREVTAEDSVFAVSLVIDCALIAGLLLAEATPSWLLPAVPAGWNGGVRFDRACDCCPAFAFHLSEDLSHSCADFFWWH